MGSVGGLLVWALLALGFLTPPSQSDTLTIPNTFSVGQVADPTTVNANFSAIANIVNGKIDNDNWDAAGPDLAYANMALAGTIVTGDIVDGTIATIDIAANATTENFQPTDPSDATGFSCGTTIADVTGYTATSTFNGGSVIAIISGTFDPTSIPGGDPKLTLTVDIDGVSTDTMTWTPSPGAQATPMYTIVSSVSTLTGSKTIKLRCTSASGTYTIDFTNASWEILEIKK